MTSPRWSGRLAVLAGLLTAGGFVAACDRGRAATKPVGLSFSTMSSRAIANVGQGSARLVANATAPDTIIFTKAQIVLSHVELTRSTGSEAGPAGPDGEHDVLLAAPLLITLPLMPGAIGALHAPVPEGNYVAFQADIDVVQPDDDHPDVADFLQANPLFHDISIRLEGTYVYADAAGVRQTKPFVFTSDAHAELSQSFDPPLVVNKDGINITVRVNLNAWFRTAAGAVIDPTTANPGGPNAAVVTENIRKAFTAFEDDNENG